MPTKWEIWLANFKFEDNPAIVKARPVLVLSTDRVFFLSAKITSHAPRAGFPNEYRIVRWKEAGLKTASTVRLSKRLDLVRTDFVHKIGRLHPFDIVAVQKLLS